MERLLITRFHISIPLPTSILPGSPPGRGSLASTASNYAGLQTDDTFTGFYNKNGLAIWFDFTPPAPLNITAKDNQYTHSAHRVLHEATAGRTVKITYTVRGLLTVFLRAHHPNKKPESPAHPPRLIRPFPSRR